MDMGGDLTMPVRKKVDPGGSVGPRTPAKGREGIDLNVGMFRPLVAVHPNQMLFGGRFLLNSEARLGSLIHNHNHHHHHNPNGVSVGSGSGCDLNFLPGTGGIVHERMVGNENMTPRWVERCRTVMPPDQGVIDLTAETATVNCNGEELVVPQQRHQHQHQVEGHIDLGLSRLQNVILAGNVRVPSEQGEGEAVVVSPSGLNCQQLVGEKQGVIGEEQVIDLNKTPQQKARRKKHRPKVIREGKKARTPRTATPKPVTPKPGEKPTGKRKYVRKKNVSKPAETPSEPVGESAEPGNASGLKSARRSLDFISEGMAGEGSTASAPMSGPMFSFNTHSSQFQDKSVSAANNLSILNRDGSRAMHAGMSLQTRIPLDLDQSTSQNPTWLENPEISASNSQFLGRGYAATNHVPGELRGNPAIPTPYPQWQGRGHRSMNHIQRNPEIPTPPLLQTSRNRRMRDDLNNLATSNEIRFRNNLNGPLSDLLLDVTRKDRDANKKRRLEDQNKLSYKASRNWNLSHVERTRPSQFTFADAQRLMAIEKMKASEVMIASHPVERNESMISNITFQANSLMLAINSSMNYNLLTTAEKPFGDGNLNSKDPVTPEKPSSKRIRGQDGVIRKPRTRRGDRATNSNAKAKTRNTMKEKFSPNSIWANANTKKTPEHQAESQNNGSLHKKYTEETPLVAAANRENHSRHLKISCIQDCQSSSDFQGSAQSTITSLAPMPYKDPVDDIIQKLTRMSINRTPEDVTAEAQNALVPYNGGGTMVPYEGPHDPAKRRRPRPKVDLDPETSRVWRLLLIKDSIDGDNELDKNKEKWWEEERRVFRGRVDSFIARMHLVQGDRRFSPWKGSVVDSVVGVFLTQNVSDHLSSSAFMSLAAKFPLKPDNKPNVEKEGKSFKPEHCISSFNDAIKFQELQGKKFPHNNYIVTHEAEDIEEQQIVDSQNSPGIHLQSRDGPIGYSKDEDIFFHEREVEASHPSPDSRMGSPFTVSPSLSSSEAGFRSSPEDAGSKQKSVVSSQNSSEYPAQTVDQMGTCLESNPRSEELAIDNMCNFLDGYTSFTNLLKMAENTKFQKLYTSSNGGISSEYGSPINQLTSTVTEKGTSILDLLDNPNSACSSMVMANDPGHACHDFMGVASKSSTSNYHHSSNFLSEEKTTVYGVGEERAHLPFASMNFMADNIADGECIASARNKADITDKLESSTSETSLLGAYAPVQKKPLPQLDGLAGETCFAQQLPMGALDTALGKTILTEDPKPQGQYLTKDQKINEETGALGEISRPTAAVQTRNSMVYQFPTSSPDNIEQATQNLGTIETKSNDEVSISEKAPANTMVDGSNRKRPRAEAEKKKDFDWDSLRKQVFCEGIQTERSSDRMDSVDWEAVRLADVHEISETIRERGMNNMLAERIKDFLNRLVKDHGSIDLEWLRDIPPDKTKEYLLSIRGLGLKSVECVRLLTLHHLAFPVDTNVGRISVRLGWVPLQPLPESLQLHLLELYPVLETIQKYLWPRLCRLDQRTLYELHYQLITFGKVFCTKSKPNCNACPMRGECKHFASAFASARLALPGPEEKSVVSSVTPIATVMNQNPGFNPVPLPQLLEGNNLSQEHTLVKNCEPIIEEPATPEPECIETSESAIEDYFDEDPDEIPTIKLNLEEFTQNLQNFMQENNLDIQEGDMSKALVALAPEAASIPMPKLKNVSRLRTEHQVYELPDEHPLLEGLDRREADDPCSYLLAIWTPGETSQSNEPPEICCNSQETGKLCDRITCFSCNSVREAQSQIVRATLLIPCRTAMRGSFPLNGTYFQVNEVFADHESSHNPITVPREYIWNLPRRTVYFGTSTPSIFRGLSTEGIQHCFWRGFVCVRGFDRVTRAPRPLSRRLHFSASKVTRDKKNGSKKEE